MVEFNYLTDVRKLVCKLNGKFSADENTVFSARLEEKIEEILHSMPESEPFQICFDMKSVTFIASAFIRTCLVTSRRVGMDEFSITNASPMIKKTFMIAGLDKELRVS